MHTWVVATREAMNTVDTHALETKVKDIGYSPYNLDCVPAPAIDSFAGVGHHFGLAALQSGEHVLDLGSGSSLDSFVAALEVGRTGQVVGIDMTTAQIEKATELRHGGDFSNVSYVQGYIDELPFEITPLLMALGAVLLRAGGEGAVLGVEAGSSLGSRQQCVADVDEGDQSEKRTRHEGALDASTHDRRYQCAQEQRPKYGGADDFQHCVLAIAQIEVAQARKDQRAKRGLLRALELLPTLVA